LILYSYPGGPTGAVMTIVPVGTVQVGWTVTVAVGATGGVGKTFNVYVDSIDTQVGSIVDLTLIV